MEHQGHRYYYKSKFSDSRYYLCKNYQLSSCIARLVVGSEGCMRVAGTHICESSAMAQERDARVEIRNVIEMRSMEAMPLSLGLVWSNARDTMARGYGEVAGLQFFNKSGAINLIKCIRNEATDGDILRAIEGEPARFVSKEDPRGSLQFITSYSLTKAYRRIIGLAHSDLMHLMRYDGATLFIEATFEVAPKPFYQTLTVMVCDRAHDLYLPCVYILMEAMDNRAYYHAFQLTKVQCDQKCVPAVVDCDFESVRQTAVKTPFRKKEIPFVMSILYTKIDRVGNKTMWDQFSRYFMATKIKPHKSTSPR
ncbi:hypothetical protein BBJ28_00022320 [Nothophytophthora sp. Chile5]|nr:hypothetical protein BBJ28_00022320 [Nothophytophthora sp. Chile5]